MNIDERLEALTVIVDSIGRRCEGLSQTTELLAGMQIDAEKRMERMDGRMERLDERVAELIEADTRLREIVASLAETMKSLAGMVIDHKHRIENVEGKRPQ